MCLMLLPLNGSIQISHVSHIPWCEYVSLSFRGRMDSWNSTQYSSQIKSIHLFQQLQDCLLRRKRSQACRRMLLAATIYKFKKIRTSIWIMGKLGKWNWFGVPEVPGHIVLSIFYSSVHNTTDRYSKPQPNSSIAFPIKNKTSGSQTKMVLPGFIVHPATEWIWDILHTAFFTVIAQDDTAGLNWNSLDSWWREKIIPYPEKD